MRREEVMAGEVQNKLNGGGIQGSFLGGRPPGVWLASPTGVHSVEESSLAHLGVSLAHGDRRILLIAEDEDLGDWLLEEFRRAGAVVALATSGREGLALVQSGLVDVVVSEMGLTDLPGIDLLRELRTMSKMPKVILTTSRNSDFLAKRAIEQGASAVLCKPFGIGQLWALVAQALGN
jgi:CheY-like chemotaxis protein